MGRVRKVSEWRGIKVNRPTLSLGAEGNTIRKRANSGNYLSPWQVDRWSFNPQSVAVVSSPTMNRKGSSPRDGYHTDVVHSGVRGGISLFKLGAILFSVMSIFLVGLLLSILIG